MTYVPWVILLLDGNKPFRPPCNKKRIKIGVNRLVFVLILSAARGAKDERGRNDVWKNFMATE